VKQNQEGGQEAEPFCIFRSTEIILIMGRLWNDEKNYSAWVNRAPSRSFLRGVGSTGGRLNERYVNKKIFSLRDSDRPSVAAVHSAPIPDS